MAILRSVQRGLRSRSLNSSLLPLSSGRLRRSFHIESANTTTRSHLSDTIIKPNNSSSLDSDQVRQSSLGSAVLPISRNLVQIDLRSDNSTLDLNYSNTSILALSRSTKGKSNADSGNSQFDSVFITPRNNSVSSSSSPLYSSVDTIQITLDGSRDWILMDHNCSIISSRSDRQVSPDYGLIRGNDTDSLNIPTFSARFLRANNAQGTRIPLSNKTITGRGSLHIAPLSSSSSSSSVSYNSCRATRLSADESMVVDINHLLAYDCDSNRSNNLSHPLQMFNVSSLDASLVSPSPSPSSTTRSISSQLFTLIKQYFPNIPPALTTTWNRMVSLGGQYMTLRANLVRWFSLTMNRKNYVIITGPSTVIYSSAGVMTSRLRSRSNIPVPPPFLVDEIELGSFKLPKMNDSVPQLPAMELRPIDCLKVVTVNQVTGEVTFRSTDSFIKN